MDLNKIQQLTKKIEVLTKFNLKRTSLGIYLAHKSSTEAMELRAMYILLEDFCKKSLTDTTDKLQKELSKESSKDGIQYEYGAYGKSEKVDTNE